MDQTIRDIKRDIDLKRAELFELERQLRQLLHAAVRRPGDGSDQPALFEVSIQARLF